MSNLMQRNAIDNIIKTASNFDEKTNMLIKQFFSNTRQVDFSDTHAYRYSDVVFESKKVISKDEIRQTIKRSKSDSASESNEIFNKVLKLLMKKLMFTLMNLFRICAEQNYHSRCFKETHIIFLKKSNKNNYTNFKTYRFIALFNILDKTLKSIIVKRISNFAETHKLLFETQMSERRKRACETTLKFFTKQIHTVWNMSKNKMTTLLSLNVIDAYDHVSKEKLIHNLRKRRISNWIIAWIDNFMQNKCTTLRINEQSTFMNQVKIDISQNSFVSLILYLFYNADILKVFERFKYKITIIDFVNDINILTYDINITSNCRALKKIHVICELWTRRHDARFASIKYELLHLAKNHRRFDMTITINVENVIRKSTIIVRVLSVQLDIKLKWDFHIKKIQNKMITQMLVLIKLTIFTWKACFKKIKHVYNVVVRSIITYDSNTWHASHDRSDTTLFLTNKLINLQKQNLRTINETFRTTSKEILNVETQMQFIELHFAYLQTKIKMRLHEDSHNVLIIKHCDRIKRKLTQTRERKRRQVDITSRERKRVWFAKLCAENESTMQNDNSMTNKSLKKTLHDRWERFWSKYQTKNRRRVCVALTSQIFKKRLKLHDNLFKIENSLITQMRTNRIELAKYLFHRRVFIIVISACFCDWLKQTLKHVMLFCLNHSRTRESMLFVAKTQNLRRLLNINKKIRMMTRWLIKTDILAQFSLAIERLEWFRSVMWAKRMHTESTERSQYFAFKTITRRLDDERAEKDFYFSEDFSLIHIVYSNFRMSRLKSMTQRVWNIIIIILIIYFENIIRIKNIARFNNLILMQSKMTIFVHR
jgi:predicted RNA binding protein with dsRBD fold (UPF0201 family)